MHSVDYSVKRNMPRRGTVLAMKFFIIFMVVVLKTNAKKTSNSDCSCTISGGFYSLKSLARLDGQPRLSTEYKNWDYGYNPCVPFTMRPPCEDVAICLWDSFQQSFTPLGLSKKFKCQLHEGMVELVYPIPNSQKWNTRIRLKCNLQKSGIDDGVLKVIDDSSNPVLELEHKCCCPNACTDDKPPLPTRSPVSDTTMYTIYEWTGVIAGVLGLSLVVFAIVYYCRRINKRRRENAQLIENQRQVGYGGADIRHNGEASDSDNDAHPVQVSGSEDNDCSGEENYFPAPSPKQAVEHIHLEQLM